MMYFEEEEPFQQECDLCPNCDWKLIQELEEDGIFIDPDELCECRECYENN